MKIVRFFFSFICALSLLTSCSMESKLTGSWDIEYATLTKKNGPSVSPDNLGKITFYDDGTFVSEGGFSLSDSYIEDLEHNAHRGQWECNDETKQMKISGCLWNVNIISEDKIELRALVERLSEGTMEYFCMLKKADAERVQQSDNEAALQQVEEKLRMADSLQRVADNLNEELEDSEELSPSDSQEEEEVVRRPLRDENFYEGMLEEFCQTFFDEKFKATNYEEGSLRVSSVARRDNITDIVKGTICFKYHYGTKYGQDRKFIAYVTTTDQDNKYVVLFNREGGKVSKTTYSTREVPFEYYIEE